MKPGKHQRSKQRCQDVCWKVHNRAISCFALSRLTLIFGNPGATCRDDAIFSGESLFQELKSPWELVYTEPVPEVVESKVGKTY